MLANVQEEVTKYIDNSRVPEEYHSPTKKMLTKMLQHEAYNNENYEWTLDDFEIGTRLGRGQFGRVFVAREKDTGYIVALKTMLKKEIVRDHIEQRILREIEIQSNLKHPNILELLTWFHDDHRIYLVLEFAGQGELYKHLLDSPGRRFSEHRATKYLYQVADALNYCHHKKVIHRDLKPENLLLSITDEVKLADFGLSVHTPSLSRNTNCGTLEYLPPEMVEGKFYGKYVDNWCLGILCYEFLVGSSPFYAKSIEETYARIQKADIEFPSCVPPGAVDLISKLLRKTSEARIRLSDVMNHPWVSKNRSQ